MSKVKSKSKSHLSTYLAAGVVGLAGATLAGAQQAQAAQTAEVTYQNGATTVWSNPNTGQKPTRYLTEGQAVNIQATKQVFGEKWYQIGNDEWVPAKYFKAAATEKVAAKTSDTVTGNYNEGAITIWTSPTSGAATGNYMVYGQTKSATEKVQVGSITWYKIGDNAWVPSAYVAYNNTDLTGVKPAASTNLQATSAATDQQSAATASANAASEAAQSAATASANAASEATAQSLAAASTAAANAASAEAAQQTAAQSAATASANAAQSEAAQSAATASANAASTAAASEAAQSAATASANAAQSEAAQSAATASANAAQSEAAQSAATASANAAQSAAAVQQTTNQNNAAQASNSASQVTNNNSSAGSSASNSTNYGTGAQAAISAAESQIGVNYVWGGSTPGVGLDCSGLTQYALAQAGVSIGRVTTAQESAGSKISISQLQPGDLVFWGSAGATYHVALYIGNNQYINAPQPGETVKIASISSYFMPSFGVHINY